MIVGTRYRMDAEIQRQARLGQQVARLQTEISTERRILAPSDDPTAAARVSDIARTQTYESAWAANADSAAALAGRAESNLDSLSNAMDRATEILTLARSATASDADRATYADELDAIVADIREIMGDKDSRGQIVFPDRPHQIPVGRSTTLTATLNREQVFGAGNDEMTAVLTAASGAIRSNDVTAIGDALSAAQTSQANLTAARADHGALAARIDTVRERLSSSKLVLTEERSNLEDTDISQVVAELQQKTLSLEAAQAAFARINKQTLFDLLG